MVSSSEPRFSSDDAAPPLTAAPPPHKAVLFYLRSQSRQTLLASSCQSTAATLSRNTSPHRAVPSTSPLYPILRHRRNPSILRSSCLLSLEHPLLPVVPFRHLRPNLLRPIRNPREIQMLGQTPRHTYEADRRGRRGPLAVTLIGDDVGKPGCQIRV